VPVRVYSCFSSLSDGIGGKVVLKVREADLEVYENARAVSEAWGRGWDSYHLWGAHVVSNTKGET
jgi:hypothetical protein